MTRPDSRSRDLVLGRIRAALGSPGSTPVASYGELPREYRQAASLAPPGDPALVDRLAERLTDYKAHVHRVDAGAVAVTIAEIMAPVAGRPSVVVPPGLPRQWLPETVDAVADDGLDTDRLDGVDAVVTAAAVAIAETGTIVLDGSPDQGRRAITLVPDRHVCVLRPEQVVAGVPDAVARLAPTRPLTFISGPSATSDIELNRVEGVHGPRTLHVIIAD